MTKIELRFDHRDEKNCSYFKPVDDHRARGPSLLVNRTAVSKYFDEMDPKNTRATLVVQDVSTPCTSRDARSPRMTRIELRFHHIDNSNFSYFKPVDDHRARGPSLLVNRTFVDDYFRNRDPKKARVTLVVEEK